MNLATNNDPKLRRSRLSGEEYLSYWRNRGLRDGSRHRGKSLIRTDIEIPLLLRVEPDGEPTNSYRDGWEESQSRGTEPGRP